MVPWLCFITSQKLRVHAKWKRNVSENKRSPVLQIRLSRCWRTVFRNGYGRASEQATPTDSAQLLHSTVRQTSYVGVLLRLYGRVHRSSGFEYCEMDTDSANMTIVSACLDKVIKPTMREQYHRGLKGFCTDTDTEPDAGCHCFPRTCCTQHANYNKRTTGLFKIEYEGNEMIGLCSKMYIVAKQKNKYPKNKVAAYHLLRRNRTFKKNSVLTSRGLSTNLSSVRKGSARALLKSLCLSFEVW